MLRVIGVICFAGLLAACAAIPDVEYSYYLSKMNAVATVTQNVTCAPDMQLVIVNTASLVPTYSADLARGPYKIRIRAIEGAFSPFADSDASFTFFDDGRLKTINQNTTGQGETIIKSIVSLSTTVAGLAHLSSTKATDAPTPCDVVSTWADKSKSGGTGGPPSPAAVSLSYELNLPPTDPITIDPTNSIKLVPTEASSRLYTALIKAGARLPEFALTGTAFETGSRVVNLSALGSDPRGNAVNLTLQKVATVEIRITADKQNTSDGKKTIWKGNVPIPTAQTYDLPIPTAALFGTQKLGLTLSEAGAITAVDYGKNSGAAGATNAANSVATALTPETTSARAGDIKAQADVIAQQQRLNRCQANPTTCQ
jgi:hypothetical protein